MSVFTPVYHTEDGVDRANRFYQAAGTTPPERDPENGFARVVPPGEAPPAGAPAAAISPFRISSPTGTAHDPAAIQATMKKIDKIFILSFFAVGTLIAGGISGYYNSYKDWDTYSSGEKGFSIVADVIIGVACGCVSMCIGKIFGCITSSIYECKHTPPEGEAAPLLP